MKWIGLVGWKDYNLYNEKTSHPTTLLVNTEHMQIILINNKTIHHEGYTYYALTEILCIGYGVVVIESIADIRKLLGSIY